MSGPIAIEYVLVSALLDAAWGAYQAERQRRYEEAYRQQAEADRRSQERRAAALQREEERRAREEAKRRAEQAAALMIEARSQEKRLERVRLLAVEARTRLPQFALEVPPLPSAPADTSDPEAVRRYMAAIEASVRLLEERMRGQAAQAASDRGQQELMQVLASGIGAAPRTAADVLQLYAEQLQALQPAAKAQVMDRRATAGRILGRLAGLADGEVPPELDALMRRLVAAESDQRAEMLALELRAQVHTLNEARAQAAHAAAENRSREMAGVLVAEVLADLGYEVEPIAETLFVSGGVAHFQRAEWGDYYVRMRVDPETRNVNFNMVRAGTANAPPDAAQRKRDEEMEATWCAGVAKLLAELAARGIETRKLRELDAGAVPVQVVSPASIDAAVRDKEHAPAAASAPQQRARPLS